MKPPASNRLSLQSVVSETRQQANYLEVNSRQDSRYESEGKRKIRRRDNSRFAANPHIVKPTATDFGVYSSLPRETFPVPLPPFLPRHAPAPSALVPGRDPISANAGRYSLSLKGVRRELRRSAPRSEQIVLDIEGELIQWLQSESIILSPDNLPSPIVTSRRPLGTSNSILEVSRSPTELVWRIDEAFPRFILHCVARFHGVVSFSKPALENDVRLTHLLRPNVMRPDFAAAGTLDTPPASDLDIYTVTVDTEDSDVASEQGNALGSEAGDMSRPSSLYVLHEDVRRENSLHRYEVNSVIEMESSAGEDDEELSWSIESRTPASDSRDWEQIPCVRNTRTTSSSLRSLSPTFRRIRRRVSPALFTGDTTQLRFWDYVFA